MANNLTSYNIQDWKSKLDEHLLDLINSLDSACSSAVQLSKITQSAQDENNLSSRFNDLASVTETAKGKLKSFLDVFDENLDTYIKTVKQAEEVAAEKAKKSIDQFAEKADVISKLKM